MVERTHGLSRSSRLITRRDFRKVYSRGDRARSKHIVVVAQPRQGHSSRLGVSVSKAHGRAVRRNKIKRIFREAFRLERDGFPVRYDLVLIPQAQERYPLGEIRRELTKLVADLSRRKHRPNRRSKTASAGTKKRRGRA